MARLAGVGACVYVSAAVPTPDPRAVISNELAEGGPLSFVVHVGDVVVKVSHVSALSDFYCSASPSLPILGLSMTLAFIKLVQPRNMVLQARLRLPAWFGGHAPSPREIGHMNVLMGDPALRI